jgi:hypothetical protein
MRKSASDNPGTAAMKKNSRFLPLALIFFLLMMSQPAHADSVGLIMRGVARTLFSAFEIPKSMIQGSTQAFPIGIVTGTLVGSVKMVAGTLMGAADIARGAAPYAKYAILAGA